MSILSVITQMYYQVNLGTTVPAKFFTPPPKVDSRVLILTKRPKPLFGNQDPANLFRLVKAGFSERRKKIRNSLAGGMQIEKEAAEKLLKKADIDGELRAQNLSLDDWLKLTKLWQA
jgi:16S rRNA (adenine1518-N6/adenine1519-N6)-dimethyltransferase